MENDKIMNHLSSMEEKYSILDDLLEGCHIISSDGRYLYVNNAAAKQNRVKKEDTLGKHFMEVHPGIEKTELFFKCQRCFEEGVSSLVENEHTFPDGHKAWFEIRIEPVPEGVFILSLDITQRKKAEEKLRQTHDNLEETVQKRTVELEEAYESLKESEEKFREIFNKVNDMISLNEMVDGFPGNFIEINEVGSSRLGYSKEELLNMGPANIVAPDKRKEMPGKALKLVGDGFNTFEIVHVTKDLRRIPVEVNNHLINYRGRKVCFAVSRDITERKQMEEDLKESEEKFREIFNNAKDMIALNLMNEDNTPGRFIEINEVGIKRLGYSKDEFLKMTPQDIISPEEQTQKITETLLEKGHAQSEHVDMAKNGLKIPVEVNSHLFKLKEKNVTLTISRDISDRKKAEKEKEILMDELKRSNEELQHFAHVASHDLQEPLRTIASFTQLLEQRYKDQLDDDAEEFMDYIVDAAGRMRILINGLLKYSRVTTTGKEFEPVDAEEVLDNVLGNLQILIEENNAEITHDKLPIVTADKSQLIQLFQNLIGNAIKFKKENEPLKIHISCRKDEENNEYTFSIADNGIGMEKQYAERIFVIFQRLHTSDEYKGTGMGLAICKRIIEHHGGRIWVESELNQGSIFYFTIPA